MELTTARGMAEGVARGVVGDVAVVRGSGLAGERGDGGPRRAAGRKVCAELTWVDRLDFYNARRMPLSHALACPSDDGHLERTLTVPCAPSRYVKYSSPGPF